MYAYHRKTLLSIGLVVLLSLLLGQAALAQEQPTSNAGSTETGGALVTAVPLADSPPGTIEISLEQLNRSNLTLRGPIDSDQVDFSLPYRWQLKEGGYFQLYYDLLFDAVGQTSTPSDAARVFLLEVYFDDELVAALNLQQVGRNQSLQLPLPTTANTPDNNRHTLRFVLTTGRDCDTEGRTSFNINNLSFLHLEYGQLAPDLDLAAFPRPLVQELLAPEVISLVIPDNYTSADLSAVASLGAMLGQKTDNNILLNVLTTSQATPEQVANTHLVLVGTPQNNSLIADWYARGLLPTQLNSDGAIVAAEEPVFADDGVVQLAQTEATDPVVLVVTGSTEAGVARAAQALSVRPTDPRFGFTGSLAIIQAINEVAETASEEAITVNTLAELGFRDTTIYGVGTQSKTVSFFVPSNWRLTDDPLLLLNYIPSALLEPEASALTVYLNNRPIGSTILDGSTEGERELLVKLPADEVLLGDTNRLRLEVTMDVAQPCTEPDLGLAWTRIKDNGRLQLAHIEVTQNDEPMVIRDPLTPLISRFDLGNVWFALPETPTANELNGMAGIAAILGDISRGYNFAPQVTLGAAPEDAVLADAHMVMVGEPERNSVIGLVNEELPQPFAPGSNEMQQKLGSVIFRLPQGFSLGIIETIHAPWNPHRAVTVATGTNAEGVSWALNALGNNDLSSNLDGNLSFVRQDQIEALDLNSQDVAQISLQIIPETVSRVTQAAEAASITTTAPAADTAAAEVVELVEPTVVPQDLPEPGPLPDYYQPEAAGLGNMRGAAIGLIGGGLLVAALGLFFNARRARGG